MMFTLAAVNCILFLMENIQVLWSSEYHSCDLYGQHKTEDWVLWHFFLFLGRPYQSHFSLRLSSHRIYWTGHFSGQKLHCLFKSESLFISCCLIPMFSVFSMLINTLAQLSSVPYLVLWPNINIEGHWHINSFIFFNILESFLGAGNVTGKKKKSFSQGLYSNGRGQKTYKPRDRYTMVSKAEHNEEG